MTGLWCEVWQARDSKQTQQKGCHSSHSPETFPNPSMRIGRRRVHICGLPPSPHQSSGSMSIQRTFVLRSYQIPGTHCKAIHALWILGRYEEPSRSSTLDSRSRGVHSTLRSTGLEQIPTPLYRLVRCWRIRLCRLQGYNPLLQFLISANGACNCAFFIDPHHWPRTEPITFKYKCFLVPSKKSWPCVLKNLPSNTAWAERCFLLCVLCSSV